MDNNTYYFHKHMLLFKDVLEEIINFDNNQYYNRDDMYDLYNAEDRDFDEHGRYIHDNDDYDDYNNNWNNDEKLYGFTDCYETYWDSIYG